MKLTRIVDTSLNSFVKGESIWGYYITIFLVHSWCEDLCHPVVVFAEFWEVLIRGKVFLVQVCHVTGKTGNTLGSLAIKFHLSNLDLAESRIHILDVLSIFSFNIAKKN